MNDVLTRQEIRKKFPAVTDQRTAEVLAVLDSGQQIELSDIPPVSCDPKDDIFLASAAQSKADYLVSEDKDLLDLKTHGATKIVNALEFLHILQPPASDHQGSEQK